MSPAFDAIDGFAGPGGWDIAARQLGLNVLGVENDPAACATRRAAGLPTIEADIRSLDPLDHPYPGFIASPPCQTFSMAGKGAGRAQMDQVLGLISGRPVSEPLRDERTALVLEPYRWIFCRYINGDPFEWVAMEQVPTVLPIWQAYAERLEGWGYNTATGVLSAEQFGVPQTRKRAIFLARLGAPVKLPEPTHSRYHPTDRNRLDDGLLPWVPMAAALGYGATERPSMTVTGGGTATGGAEPFGTAARAGLERERERAAGGFRVVSNYGSGGDPKNRGVRTAQEPSAAITSKADRMKVLHD